MMGWLARGNYFLFKLILKFDWLWVCKLQSTAALDSAKYDRQHDDLSNLTSYLHSLCWLRCVYQYWISTLNVNRKPKISGKINIWSIFLIFLQALETWNQMELKQDQLSKKLLFDNLVQVSIQSLISWLWCQYPKLTSIFESLKWCLVRSEDFCDSWGYLIQAMNNYLTNFRFSIYRNFIKVCWDENEDIIE